MELGRAGLPARAGAATRRRRRAPRPRSRFPRDGGRRWTLLNASPDLPAQLRATPALHPRPEGGAIRHSPIAAVVLTGAEADTIAGLLSLRERHAFALYGAEPALAVLAENPIFGVLDPALVPRRRLPLGEAFDAAGCGGRDARPPRRSLRGAGQGAAVPGSGRRRSGAGRCGRDDRASAVGGGGRRRGVAVLHPRLRGDDRCAGGAAARRVLRVLRRHACGGTTR